MIILRALGALLCYPREDMRRALPEIADAIRTSPLIGPRQRDDLLALIDDIGSGELLEAEERYVELFDRGRAVSLHLFEHLHGDGRDRGQAMVDLKKLYARAGYELSARELPDYLPVVLEYLSCRDLREARELLGDCADILRRIGHSLIARGSGYAAVVQALLVLTGEAAIDVAAVPRVTDRTENLDADWFERPAFAGEPLASAMSGGTLARGKAPTPR
jgi:nitrate reductase molybdenum cofactor assembly chaperone NarJ/NarW